jgi:predicted RNA binding protein YcfA (HicA-like mRNA interferase family)
MPKLPALSAREVMRALSRLGFDEVSQRGSHAKMRRGAKTCIVPIHAEIKKGTLRGILQQADLTPTEFLKALSQ